MRFEVREYQNGLINFSFPSSRLRSWLPTVAPDSYAAKRRLSSWSSQGAIWFQLAKVRVTKFLGKFLSCVSEGERMSALTDPYRFRIASSFAAASAWGASTTWLYAFIVRLIWEYPEPFHDRAPATQTNGTSWDRQTSRVTTPPDGTIARVPTSPCLTKRAPF